jgi:nucleoside phosphorylase
MDFKPRVLLVTALPREMAAVEATFDRPATTLGQLGDPFIYKKGSYLLPDGATERTVLLATLPVVGTDSAAAIGAHALRTFPSVEHILMVGIDGGCPNAAKPDEHVRLGDVVVSDKGIMDYGHVKLTPEGPEYRSPAQAPCGHARRVADQQHRQRDRSQALARRESRARQRDAAETLPA